MKELKVVFLRSTSFDLEKNQPKFAFFATFYIFVSNARNETCSVSIRVDSTNHSTVD